MTELDKFVAILKAKITAWYLTHEDDYSGCGTCGYDDRKPDHDTVCCLIDETLEEMKLSSRSQ